MSSKQQFDEFIVKYMDSAQRIAEIYIKNPEDAKDIVAESIEKALRNIHTLKDPDTMKFWFNRIIMNTAIDFFRKQPKSIEAEITRYHFDEFSRINFESLLGVLPTVDREILSLRFCDNCTLREIGEILGINENTIKSRFYRALKKLKLEVYAEEDKQRNARHGPAVKSFIILLAAILFSASIILNLSPALAAAAYDIPVIGDIVRVITFNRFEFHENGYNAEIITPAILGLLDPELQDRLNAEFRDEAEALIREFEQAIIDVKADQGEDVFSSMSLKLGYTVRTDNERILSLDTYLYSDVSGFELHKFCTIDKLTDTLITLPSLFMPGADYVTAISEYIAAEMERRNIEEDAEYYFGDEEYGFFSAIRPEHNFYINSDGKFVICFDRYEVAAGSMRSPEFIIPPDILDGISSDYLDELMK